MSNWPERSVFLRTADQLRRRLCLNATDDSYLIVTLYHDRQLNVVACQQRVELHRRTNASLAKFVAGLDRVDDLLREMAARQLIASFVSSGHETAWHDIAGKLSPASIEESYKIVLDDETLVQVLRIKQFSKLVQSALDELNRSLRFEN